MGSEILLYGYGLVCLSMLVFNIIYNITLKGSDVRMEKRVQHYEAQALIQVQRVRRKEPMEKRYFTWLRYRLFRVKNLIAFDRVMDQIDDDGDEAERQYWERILDVLLKLARTYQRRDNLQAAYFAYFVCRYEKKNPVPPEKNGELQEFMVECMKKKSFYCQLNALQALYAFGDVEYVMEAVRIQDTVQTFYNEKILTEGLLSFSGDHDELIHRLWDNFDYYSERTKLSVLNYIRFQTGDYCNEMFGIMTSESVDKELRFSAIRYFGKYPYEPARQVLIGFVSDTDQTKWEYAAISATSLAGYHGNDVIRCLTEAMKSPNWYVRYNASVSLEAQHLDYSDLIDVVDGDDRYAREMVMYRLESRRIREAEEKDREKEKEKEATEE